jgi:O-antigen/teichoic acid export membrane protein
MDEKSQNDPSPAAPSARLQTLGRVASSGAAWMISVTAFTKLISFATQVILGWKLLDTDFGVFAAAAAFAKLISICQDGGVRELLVREGLGRYPELAGRAFWYCLVFNTVGMLLVAASAPGFAHMRENPDLLPVLLVIALSIPLTSPAAVLQTKLRMEFRFAELSRVQIISSLIRASSSVGLAYMGFGPLCLAVPMVVGSLYESLASWWVTGDSHWYGSARSTNFASMLGMTIWIILASVSNLLLDQGPYLAIPAVLDAERGFQVNGLYFWAFQVIAQFGVLLSFNMQLVLGPVFSHFNNDTVRQREAGMRAMRALMVIGSLSCLGMACVIHPLERMLWHGRWDAAIVPIQIFGLFFPFRILFGLTTAVQQARGHFREYFVLTALEGIAFTGAAALGAYATGTAEGAAWYSSIQLALGRVIVTFLVMWKLGAGFASIAKAMFPAWILAVLAALTALAVDQVLGLDGIARLAVVGAELRQGAAGLTETVVHGLRLLLIGVVCTLSFVALARLLLPGEMRDAASSLPRGLGPRALRLLGFEP